MASLPRSRGQTTCSTAYPADLARRAAPTPDPSSGMATTLSEKHIRYVMICNALASCTHIACAVAVASVTEFKGEYDVFLQRSSSSCSRVGAINMGALVFVWEVVTSFFHFGNILLWRGMYVEDLRQCKNVVRWIEYSITATLMSIALSLIAGAVSVTLLLAVAALCISTIFAGLSAEQMASRTKFGYKTGETDAMCIWNVSQTTALGFIPFLAEWSVTFTSWWGSECYKGISEHKKSVITLILTIEFSLWTLFPAIQIYQFYHAYCSHKRFHNTLSTCETGYWKGEIAYQILSLTAKLFLSIAIISAGLWDSYC